MTKQTHYIIKVYDSLSTEEKEILKTSGSYHGFHAISFPPFTNGIEMCSSNREEDILREVANWLDRVGAVEDIFSITQVSTLYTNREFEVLT